MDNYNQTWHKSALGKEDSGLLYIKGPVRLQISSTILTFSFFKLSSEPLGQFKPKLITKHL